MSRNAGETRLRILSAARNLYSLHGFCGTSLEDILTAAGVTKGAFYHHFKSKEHVCEFLLDDGIAAIGRYAAGLDSFEATYSRILHWARGLLTPGDDGLRPHCRLVLRLTGEVAAFRAPLPDKINGFWKEWLAVTTHLLRQAPVIHPAGRQPEEAAAWLLAVFGGALWMRQSSASAIDPESVLEMSLEMLVSPQP